MQLQQSDDGEIRLSTERFEDICFVKFWRNEGNFGVTENLREKFSEIFKKYRRNFMLL